MGNEWLWMVAIQMEVPTKAVSVKGSTDLAIVVSLHRVMLITYS